MLMLAQRQLEIENDEAEKKNQAGVKGESRPRPRKINHAETSNANIKDLAIQIKNGEEAYQQLDDFARRNSQWSHVAILKKLLESGMISQDDYADMVAKGQRYVPLTKLRQMIPPEALDTIQEDESTKEVVHYL